MSESPPSSGVFTSAKRSHVADDVFDQLAGAILRGELPAGSGLPPERTLAAQFGTSRIIARQAIHRLAEHGLVRVRQGGATIVLDADSAGDLRNLELYYRLTPQHGPKSIDPRHAAERQLLQGYALVEVAARCAKKSDLVRIEEMAKELAAGPLTEARFVAFEEGFWRAVASAGKNRILAMELAWWYRLLRDHPRADRRASSPIAERAAFYGALAARLARGEDAATFYLGAIQPMLHALRPSREAREQPASAPKRASR
jgi:DNA-binding FadR family transcriptional regulator